MRVRGGDNVGTRSVNTGVNGERSEIDFRLAFDNLAGVIHQNQVRYANPAEMQTEGIDPETIEALGIARGDVSGDAFVETIFGEEAKRGGQAFLAMATLFGGRMECRRARETLHKRGVSLRRGRRLRHEDLQWNAGGAEGIVPQDKEVGKRNELEKKRLAPKTC